MSTDASVMSASHVDAQSELHELRLELFPAFLYMMVGLPLIWLAYSVLRDWGNQRAYLIDLAMVVLFMVTLCIAFIRKKHFGAARLLFVLALIVAYGLWIYVYPTYRTMTFGLVILVLAQSLFSDAHSFVLSVLLVSNALLFYNWGRGQVAPLWEIFWIPALYALIWLTTWLASRPLRIAISRSLGGWERAHVLVRQVQERRAELYRALRSLEEATYRIERMNGELLLAQRGAEEARANKERFVAAVSHEIRGPLNLILGYSRLMALSPERYGAPLPSLYRRDVAVIYRNSRHLADLVDDILDLSQIEANSLPLVKDCVDLESDVIVKALNMVQPLAERKGLYMRYEPTDEPGEILADAVRLRQVVVNILLNAVRFTERGGVTIHAQRDADSAVVSIRDTGPGISKEGRAGLFREFHKAHLPTDPEDKSSGLGLAISKHLVELHNGRIWVESEPGRGTTFSFALPLHPGTAIAPGLVRRTPSALRASGSRHVIVHAPLHLVRLLSRRLEGYRVVGVSDPNEIPRLIDELHPQALVLDAATVEDLWGRIEKYAYDVPVIGCHMPQSEVGSHLGTALAYLIKPITTETVMAVMQQLEREGETTILLVDDDPDAVELLETMLLSLPRPYHLLKAYDGAQALELMGTRVPDAVFLDMLMPGMNGQETLSRMRADERLREVPVVIVSARDIDESLLLVDTPITVRCKRPLDVTSMAGLLKAVLDAVGPDYLLESTP